MNLESWESKFEEKIIDITSSDDPAHDILHFRRVVKLAKDICKNEGGKYEIVVPAAWLHDFVIIPKNEPLRSKASSMAREQAIEFLSSINYPSKYFDEIGHAILAHSFSANVDPTTLEAKIVQDADRLDGLGAIGIARCFATAGIMKTSFYSELDPFCSKRAHDDSIYTLDHFYKKLFKVALTLKTKTGLEEGRKRVEFMKLFLTSLQDEIKS